jgi:hypothetical protein
MPKKNQPTKKDTTRRVNKLVKIALRDYGAGKCSADLLAAVLDVREVAANT